MSRRTTAGDIWAARVVAGTEVIVNGGKIESVKDCGDAPGTQIEVRQLFYNLPARRKFLRTENTESSHVEHQLHLQAIGHPEIGFVFLNDDRLVYQLPYGRQGTSPARPGIR